MNQEILKYQVGTIDTHLHTRHSCDSQMEPTEACRRAMELGLKALVFTEHVDFDPADQGYGVYDDRAIESSLAECRVMAGQHLKVYKGVEITFQTQYRDQIEKFIRSGRFDLVIGSVHMVGADDVSRPELADKYFGRLEEEPAYRAYLQEVLRLVESRLFDCLGHLDLCKRYGVRRYGAMLWQRYQRPIRKIMERAIQQGLMVEINTSGLRHDPQETYPALPAVMEYLKMGGTQLTLGSDAHQPEHIAFGFADVLTKIPELKGVNKK